MPSQAKSASTLLTPKGGKSGKKAGPHSTRVAIGRFAPASSSLLDSPMKATTTTTTQANDLSLSTVDIEDEARGRMEVRLKALEDRVREVEKEKREMKEELWKLRDQLEEERWARKQVEERLKTIEEVGVGEIKEVMNEEWKEQIKEVVREETKKEIKEVTNEEWKEQIMEVVKEEAKKEKLVKKTSGGEEEKQQYRCLIFTDSNGRGATPDSVKFHMPPDERGKYDIQIVVAYRLEDAFYRVRRGEIEVKDSYVVIDNVTNNVKGNWSRAREPPEQVVERVANLRELVLSLSAAACVVCEIKPMRMIDVRPYNRLIHQYLGSCGGSGFGCNTQICMDFLAADGTHISHRYASVLDRTYACALLGTPVPYPVPERDFVPLPARRSFESEWPRLVGTVGSGNFVPG